MYVRIRVDLLMFSLPCRIDLQRRIGELKAAEKTWSTVKPTSPYEEAHDKSYAVALALERKTYEKKLAAITGTVLAFTHFFRFELVICVCVCGWVSE